MTDEQHRSARAQPRPAAEFEAQRPLLTAVAYRMLGRVADAEDVVQEAWLRWSAADRDDVREPAAYLVRVTTRLAIDRLRQIKARRETYVGPWLPDPLLTDVAAEAAAGPAGGDPERRARLAESVSFAVLVVLETLSPLERAVFVLHEAFDYPYPAIAGILRRGEPAVRQLGSRARAHVRAGRARFDVDEAERRNLTERFLSAALAGDLDGLLAVLAPDAVLVGDGGGKAKAPLRAIAGAEKIARFLHAISATSVAEPAFEVLEVNGGPAVLVRSAGRPHTVFALDVADGLARTVYVMTNPERLRGLTTG